MNNQKHYAAAISAFVIWGFFSIALRSLREYSPGEILYFRILFSFLVLVAVIGLFRRASLRKDMIKLQSFSVRQRWMVIGLTLIGGLLLTVNWLTFIHIVNNINVKTASFSYLICPVMTAALGYVLIGEKLSRLQWIAVGLCALSCVLIGINSALELGYSFLTALTYALYLISQRKNQGFDRMVILGVQILFALTILTAGAQLLLDRISTEGKFFSMILFIAVAFTVLPLFLNLFALNKINSATIGILMYINPMINFILAFLLFNESITLIQTAGYLMILVALIVFNLPYLRSLPVQLTNSRRPS
jgi:chloramphenicol-sensitive protein RarD